MYSFVGRFAPTAGAAVLVLGVAAGGAIATGTAAQAASSCTTSGATTMCTYTGAGTYSFMVPSGVSSRIRCRCAPR